MVFSSLTFLIYFLPISLICYYLVPKQIKNYWLLIVSLFFYSWGAHEYFPIIILSIVCNYTIALFIDKTQKEFFRKGGLVVAIILNIGILFYYKYMNYFTLLLNQFVDNSIDVTNIVLPLGISFFTFQALSYVVDVYRRDVPVQKNPYYLGLYISFFPQLIAGPIVRYNTIVEQINNRNTTIKQFCKGATRFMSGFSQKILLANTMSIIADEAFKQCNIDRYGMSVAFAWLGAISYSLQIFFDFSGYSSMAIGLGNMFGFEFMENFNYPYIAGSISDFWRRWHISLSQWFRDYVYIPLGGNRTDKKWKIYRNLFITWLLTGIWHGANFTFLLWGLSYFILLSIERLIGINKSKNIFISCIYRIFTLTCIILLWVIFRADGFSEACHYLMIMVGKYGNPLIDKQVINYFSDYKIMFLLAILFCTPLMLKIKEFFEKKYHAEQLMTLLYDTGNLGCMILSISSLVMGGNNPFIYFNF